MDTNESAWRVVVHDAFAAGEISYSATRAITSLDGPCPEVDAALVELARSAPICDVEAAVRYYQVLATFMAPPDQSAAADSEGIVLGLSSAPVSRPSPGWSGSRSILMKRKTLR
ncbi:MAG: hypothetical protein ACYCTI_02635 [Acidimicrobiales bacterium]